MNAYVLGQPPWGSHGLLTLCSCMHVPFHQGTQNSDQAAESLQHITCHEHRNTAQVDQNAIPSVSLPTLDIVRTQVLTVSLDSLLYDGL